MKRALLVLFVGLAAAGGLAPIAVARETVLPAPRVITGVGYAPISSQPATTDEARRLLAIRASHLAPLRNLAEQILSLRVESSSRAAGSTIQSDRISATVSGVVSGARIVKITPKGDDAYETVVEVERAEGARQ